MNSAREAKSRPGRPQGERPQLRGPVRWPRPRGLGALCLSCSGSLPVVPSSHVTPRPAGARLEGTCAPGQGVLGASPAVAAERGRKPALPQGRRGRAHPSTEPRVLFPPPASTPQHQQRQMARRVELWPEPTSRSGAERQSRWSDTDLGGRVSPASSGGCGRRWTGARLG